MKHHAYLLSALVTAQPTMDKVIRREMEVAEGDPFNRTKIADSEQNIRDLNFFENVEMRATRGSSPDKSLIIVMLKKNQQESCLLKWFFNTGWPFGRFPVFGNVICLYKDSSYYQLWRADGI